MHSDQTGIHEIDAKSRDQKFIRLTLLTGTFFFLGFSSVITGFVVTIVHAIMPNNRLLNAVGTFFIFISIPLLLIGSYFLDLSDR